jgi:hypothetical protein
MNSANNSHLETEKYVNLELLDTNALVNLLECACSIVEHRLTTDTLKIAQAERGKVLDSFEAMYGKMASVADRMYAKQNKEEKHVNFFIDYGPRSQAYARFMFLYFTLSAGLKELFKPFFKDKRLFCTYKNWRYRVTGASRLGDIWLSHQVDTVDDPHPFYDLRVSISDCTEFSDAAVYVAPEVPAEVEG